MHFSRYLLLLLLKFFWLCAFLQIKANKGIGSFGLKWQLPSTSWNLRNYANRLVSKELIVKDWKILILGFAYYRICVLEFVNVCTKYGILQSLCRRQNSLCRDIGTSRCLWRRLPPSSGSSFSPWRILKKCHGYMTWMLSGQTSKHDHIKLTFTLCLSKVFSYGELMFSSSWLPSNLVTYYNTGYGVIGGGK